MKKIIFIIIMVLLLLACSPQLGGGIGVSTPIDGQGKMGSEVHRDANGTVHGSIGIAYEWTKEK